jgi:NAD+ synthase (glutamine-hydrolysing)
MRLFVGQLNPTVGDLDGNTLRILQAIDRARAESADIVLFPELAVCGYPPQDLLFHHAFIEKMGTCLERIVQASSRLMVVVGVVRRNLSNSGRPIFNSAAIIQDGRVIGFHDKMLLPTYDIFDEKRYFEEGRDLQVWEWKGQRIGVIICEDIWQHAGYVGFAHYHRDPILELVALKPDLLLNLSASPYQCHKIEARITVCTKAANTLLCPVILCCQVGGNDQLIFDGYSLYVNKKGALQQSAQGFEEDDLLVDLEEPPAMCSLECEEIEDLYRALILGVRDYFHKQGFKRACLGLSGGIDSSLVACIGAEALGRENIMGVSMPSRYSSKESVKDAELLASHLGIEFRQVPIEEPFESYLGLLKPHFLGRGLDVTEENLQARIRGMILMAISNKMGYVVLSTGNKSELAMGYCTLYGDMCGGLGVISDVTKGQVYELAEWINREKRVIPLSTIKKPPSAELRPDQKDSDSLPDYAIVDRVLKAYIEDFLSDEEIVQKYDLPIELVVDLIRRIHRAEYKRQQAPPGIRVSKKAFGVGRRYPIVQGWH